MELKYGQYYIDKDKNLIIIFEEEINGLFWFHCFDKNCSIFYYKSELKNIERY